MTIHEATEQAYKKGYEDGQRDAVPVAYGRWNKWRPPQNMVLIGVEMLNVCSECTAKYVQTFSYCPNCGAKMENEAHHVGFINVDLED